MQSVDVAFTGTDLVLLLISKAQNWGKLLYIPHTWLSIEIHKLTGIDILNKFMEENEVKTIIKQ